MKIMELSKTNSDIDLDKYDIEIPWLKSVPCVPSPNAIFKNVRSDVIQNTKKALHDFVRKGGELTAHASSKKNHDVKWENFPRKRKIKEKKKKPYRGASIFMRFSSSSLLCKSGWFSHHIQLQKNFMSG